MIGPGTCLLSYDVIVPLGAGATGDRSPGLGYDLFARTA
jgi:hypothetical protein